MELLILAVVIAAGVAFALGNMLGRRQRPPQELLVDWASSAIVVLYTVNHVWFDYTPEAAIRRVGGEGKVERFHALRVGDKHYLTTYLRELVHVFADDVQTDPAPAQENAP